MSIDYQIKQEELIKEQQFLNQYGVHKDTTYKNNDLKNETEDIENVR